MIPWVGAKSLDTTFVQKRINDCQNSRVYTNGGPFVQKLQTVIAEKLQVDPDRRVVCVNNGTSALHAIVGAYCLRSNRRLRFATQSFTFPSSAQGILYDAIILDIDDGGGLDLRECEKHLATLDGIIVTNAFGNLVDIAKYVAWCEKHSKILIFDNAGTAFSHYNGSSSHNFGDASIVSLHHTKPIGFGEGGAIVCASSLECVVRRVINFGIDNCATDKESANWSIYGNNFKMSEISAVYQLQFLVSCFDTVVATHTRLHARFTEDCRIRHIAFYPNAGSNRCAMCFAFFHPRAPEIVSAMVQKSIFSRQYYNPLAPLPVSSRFRREIVCIPCNEIAEMRYDEIWCVIDGIIKSGT